jgi:hypothetical protein
VKIMKADDENNKEDNIKQEKRNEPSMDKN